MFFEAEFFIKPEPSAGSHINDFFSTADGMAQFVGLSEHIDNINVCAIDPAFKKNSVRALFKN